MPTLIAVDARLRTVGDEITITYNAPGSGDGEIAIVPEGGDPADAVETLAAADERGTAKLDTSGWDPGAYDAVLTDGDGAEVARVSFYLRDPQAQLELSTDRRSYERGRADRGLVDRGSRQPLGLARGLQGRGVGPRDGRLPDLGLHRRTFGGHRPADHRTARPRSAPTARALRGRCRRATTSSTTCSPTSTSRPAAPSSAFAAGVGAPAAADAATYSRPAARSASACSE